MVIVEEILEDFLYFSEKNRDLSEILEELGVKILEHHNYSEKFMDIDVAKVISHISSNGNSHFYLDEKNSEINSRQALELNDLVLINQKKEVLEYSDLPDLPILQGEGIVKLDSFHNFGTGLSTSLSINYKYLLSDNVWNLYDSYYDLAKAITEIEEIFFLDKNPVNIQSREVLIETNIDNLTEKHLIIETGSIAAMPKWLLMRLHIQGIDLEDFANAVAEYVQIEYGLEIELKTIDGKYVYQIDNAEQADKSIDRIQEIWEQSSGAKFYTHGA